MNNWHLGDDLKGEINESKVDQMLVEHLDSGPLFDTFLSLFILLLLVSLPLLLLVEFLKFNSDLPTLFFDV
jgi:hypothetical protein